jgi:hypothetical protein
MKICYIISTCNKYLSTRVKYQMDTFLKNVPQEDIYYLTSQPNLKQRQFGWNCMDDTQNITWKYIYFIYNININFYDWYIFIDDDTFVFQNRLQELLSIYDSSQCYYIGKELDHIKNDFCLYMSGGAGYAISNQLYALIKSHLINIGKDNAYYYIINLKEQFCDDLCIGLWINDIKKSYTVIQLNSNLFHVDREGDIKTAITFHKVIEKEHFDYFNSILQNEIIVEKDKKDKKNKKDTVFALISDLNYFNKAKRTIIDLRTKGNWGKEIVLITIDFNLNTNFKDFYQITEVKFPLIDKSVLLSKIGDNGFNDTTDKREIYKLNQWEKLHIFDDYFSQWQRVVYLDAGLRVLEDIKYFLEIPYKNKIVAPKDGKLYEDQPFKCQISYDNLELIDIFKNEFGEKNLDSNYFLNCMWIYDTDILSICNKNNLVYAMNKYTFSKTNEMGIMNIMFHFKYNLWDRLPIHSSNNKILFHLCESNQQQHTTWRDYCMIKYPITISFEDT